MSSSAHLHLEHHRSRIITKSIKQLIIAIQEIKSNNFKLHNAIIKVTMFNSLPFKTSSNTNNNFNKTKEIKTNVLSPMLYWLEKDPTKWTTTIGSHSKSYILLQQATPEYLHDSHIKEIFKQKGWENTLIINGENKWM